MKIRYICIKILVSLAVIKVALTILSHLLLCLPTLSHSFIGTSASDDKSGTILPQKFCTGCSLWQEFLSQRRIPFLLISPSWDGFLWSLYLKLHITIYSTHRHTSHTRLEYTYTAETNLLILLLNLHILPTFYFYKLQIAWLLLSPF